MKPYGEAGKSYIQWCANMALSLNIGVPWIMCQQSDAPQSMVFHFSIFIETYLVVYSIKLVEKVDVTYFIKKNKIFLFPLTDKHMQWVLLR